MNGDLCYTLQKCGLLTASLPHLSDAPNTSWYICANLFRAFREIAVVHPQELIMNRGPEYGIVKSQGGLPSQKRIDREATRKEYENILKL